MRFFLSLLFLNLTFNYSFCQKVINSTIIDSNLNIKYFYDENNLEKNIKYQLFDDGSFVRIIERYNVVYFNRNFEKKWNIKLPDSAEFADDYKIIAKQYLGDTYILQTKEAFNTLSDKNIPQFITKVKPNGSFVSFYLPDKFNAVKTDFYFTDNKIIFINYNKQNITISLVDLNFNPLNINHKINYTLESGQKFNWFLMYHENNLFYFFGEKDLFNMDIKEDEEQKYLIKEIYLEDNEFFEVKADPNNPTELSNLVFYDSIFNKNGEEKEISDRKEEFFNKMNNEESYSKIIESISDITHNSNIKRDYAIIDKRGLGFLHFSFYYNEASNSFYGYYTNINYLYYIVFDQSDKISFLCGISRSLLLNRDDFNFHHNNIKSFIVRKYIGTWGEYPKFYNYIPLDYAIRNNLKGQITLLDNNDFQFLFVDNVKKKTGTVYKFVNNN